jgi:hypothetical protein
MDELKDAPTDEDGKREFELAKEAATLLQQKKIEDERSTQARKFVEERLKEREEFEKSKETYKKIEETVFREVLDDVGVENPAKKYEELQGDYISNLKEEREWAAMNGKFDTDSDVSSVGSDILIDLEQEEKDYTEEM